MTTPLFDSETWALLPTYFDHLPSPVRLVMWGDPNLSHGEQETAVLLQTLADHFPLLHFVTRPRRVNYPYYPVIGIMRLDDEQEVDNGLRLIGRPMGYQMTSLIAAIQAAAFQGQTLEPLTRIKLQKLQQAITLQLLTAADNESGALVAKLIFGLAAASRHIRAFLIMADVFPEAVTRYSAHTLPHLVINGRIHLDTLPTEQTILPYIAQAATTT